MAELSLKEKLKLVNEVGEEIINQEELEELFKKKKHPIAYDGFEPSGKIHIAQGLLRAINVNKMTKAGVHFKMWIADWFAMLNNKMDGDLKKIRVVGEYFIEVWKACGMDLESVEFIWTSEELAKNPDYWETVLRLSMNATVQRVLRCGQIMGREESTANPAAQIIYPLMQALDEQYLGVDAQFGGMDQRKIMVYAREYLPKIGYAPRIELINPLIRGLVGVKMSSSISASKVDLMDDEKTVQKKLNKADCIAGDPDNGVMALAQYLIFVLKGDRGEDFVIERPEKYGGNLTFKTYDELEDAFVKEELHPLDLKMGVASELNKLLVKFRESQEVKKAHQEAYGEN